MPPKTLTDLEIAQKNFLEAQLEELRRPPKPDKPIWKDASEIFKIIGSFAAVIVVCVGGYFQLTYSILSMRRDHLEYELSLVQRRIDANNRFVDILRSIPTELIDEIDTVTPDAKWRGEKKSDAHLLLLAFHVGCAEFKEAREELEEAKNTDSGDTDFVQIGKYIDAYEADFIRDASAFEKRVSCKQN